MLRPLRSQVVAAKWVRFAKLQSLVVALTNCNHSVRHLAHCVTTHRSKWFIGPYGFVLQDAKRRQFEPMSGRLNLWSYRP